MNRTRVKICGITNAEDATAAIESGTDAIGMVFYEKSPRYVTIDTAAQIIRNLPAFVNCVGLFVDADESYVRKVVEAVAIDTLQFHGQESEQACAMYNKPYIKALRMSEDINLIEQCEKYSSANALLLDTYVKGVPGGTGQAFDWNMIPKNLIKPIILAGGLHENNVKDAISLVRPYAVDVSGGVEIEKGIKDPDKIKNFIRETMNA
ncbi:MAG TPA: phosphoribosylanthranilate isomerase [Thiotrichaceae bacterium]|jgi:phosphoribosylanthranilate isomerase|nr:phosphoribosylanthranilate isomerase [Thiotrichaceae bacterium]HIM08893.1 phosphoribosylanthranilate isomerase [Gammaproteobacteria bacterium]